MLTFWKKGSWLIRILLLIIILVIVLIITTVIVAYNARSKLIADYPAPGLLIEVNEHQLHLRCMGQGSPTIIMEAGLNEFSLTWSRVQPSLAEISRVCVYDRAGLGWSDASSRPRNLNNMVNELNTLLINAEIDTPYILVGHSFGGIITRLYANQYPDDVIGMVLVDASHEDMIALRPDLFESSTEQLIAQFESLAFMSNSGIMALAPEEIPAPDYPEYAIEQYRALLVSRGYFDAAIAETKIFEDNLSYLMGINDNSGEMPLIVISRGQAEPLPFMDESAIEELEAFWSQLQGELLNLSTNSRQIMAENSGHYIQLSEPEIVIEALHELVLSLR